MPAHRTPGRQASAASHAGASGRAHTASPRGSNPSRVGPPRQRKGFPGGNYRGGTVYLVEGPLSGAASVDSADGRWYGTNEYGWFGYRLQLLDVGSDAPLLAIDAPYHDLSDEYQSTGAIFLFPATPGEPLTEDDAVARLQCLTNGCAFGGFGFDAGDTNGDGIDDLVTNAVYESETGLGMRVATALLFEGPFEDGDLRTVADADSAWSHGEVDRLGWDLDLVDDLDGDGLPDLVLGAFWAESGDDWLGKVEVLHSPLEGWGEPEPAASFWGDEDGAAFGKTVEAESDLDGDGERDLLIGIPWRGLADDSEPITGEACLFYGPFEGTREADEADACWLGQNDDDFLAETLASGFDLGADGFDDIALGTWFWPGKAKNGAAYVIRGGPQE